MCPPDSFVDIPSQAGNAAIYRYAVFIAYKSHSSTVYLIIDTGWCLYIYIYIYIYVVSWDNVKVEHPIVFSTNNYAVTVIANC